MIDILNNYVFYTKYRAIQEICTPLKKINTYGFVFIRYFKTGQFLYLSNELEWNGYFLDRFLQEKYKASDIYQVLIPNEINLWVFNQENIIWQEGIKHFDFGNGITLHSSQKKYIDVFCFFTKKDYYEVNKFYVSNGDLLKKFCTYFLQKAEHIIKEGTRYPLLIPKLYSNSVEQEKIFVENKSNQLKKMDEFLKLVDPNYPSVPKIKKLTSRELECVKLSMAGKPIKEIASELFLSSRTIETHLNNAKAKVGCHKMNELIAIIWQSGLLY